MWLAGGAALLPIAGLAGIAALTLTAYWHPSARHDSPDPTTSSGVAAGVCAGFIGVRRAVRAGGGAGHHCHLIAVSLKPELSGLSQKLTRPDILAVLQFGAVSAIILPILPNRAFGPYQGDQPYEIW